MKKRIKQQYCDLNIRIVQVAMEAEKRKRTAIVGFYYQDNWKGS